MSFANKNACDLRGNGEWDRDVGANPAGDGDRPKSTTLWSVLLTALVEWELACDRPNEMIENKTNCIMPST